jgi:hypothetical protein
MGFVQPPSLVGEGGKSSFTLKNKIAVAKLSRDVVEVVYSFPNWSREWPNLPLMV